MAISAGVDTHSVQQLYRAGFWVRHLLKAKGLSFRSTYGAKHSPSSSLPPRLRAVCRPDRIPPRKPLAPQRFKR